MTTDNLFIAITNLIPNQYCDSQVLADIIRAKIDERIKAAFMQSQNTQLKDFCWCADCQLVVERSHFAHCKINPPPPRE